MKRTHRLRRRAGWHWNAVFNGRKIGRDRSIDSDICIPQCLLYSYDNFFPATEQKAKISRNPNTRQNFYWQLIFRAVHIADVHRVASQLSPHYMTSLMHVCQNCANGIIHQFAHQCLPHPVMRRLLYYCSMCALWYFCEIFAKKLKWLHFSSYCKRHPT